MELVDGNRLQLLRAGAEFFPALEAAIAAARHEIYLETYIFADDAAGRRIARALAEAAAQGVRTHVIVDGITVKRYLGRLSERLLGGHATQRRAHLMVREDQIAATSLNIEGGPEPVKGNCGALDVPPRPSRAHPRRPAGLPRPRMAPNQTVQGSLLTLTMRITATLSEDRNSLVLR